MDDKEHDGLPVSGYNKQPDRNVRLVNEHKEFEEHLLRRIERLPELMRGAPDFRWLNIARTHFEQGFMALNRAVFKPGRVKLPEDEAPIGDMKA